MVDIWLIPAAAGNSPSPPEKSTRHPVYPRGCGEQMIRPPTTSRAYGSSPRLRGTVMSQPILTLDTRFIPAAAGNSLHGITHMINHAVHPRGCGEQARRC